MRRARLVAGLLVAGVAMLVTWIAMNTYWDTARVPGLVHGEALGNPDYAAGRLARLLGATLERLPDPLAPLPPEGQVLLLAGTNLELQPERLRAIEEWVMRGGHLVIDQSDSLGEAELQHWAGITQSSVTREPEEDAAAPQVCLSLARRDAATNEPGFELCGFLPRMRLHSARRPDFALGDIDGLQVVRIPLGHGSLAVLNANGPFDNRALPGGDHALLFATLMRVQPGAQPAARIWLLRDSGGPGLADLVWNRAAGVVILALAALALALWRAATRFGPLRPATAPMRRSLRAQIAGNARFLLARGGESTLLQAATRALDAAFTRRLPGQARLAPGERTVALARLTGLPADELGEALRADAPARNVHLTRCLGLLELARRRLLHH